MTTGMPDAPPAPPNDDPRPTPRSTPSWLPWIVTPLVVLLVGVGLESVDLDTPDVQGGSSARFVPLDGHRTISRDLDGAQTVTEHTRSIGVEGLLSAPSTITSSVLGSLGEAAVREAQWWRTSYVDDNGQRGTDLFRLSSDGVAQVASWGGSIGFVFSPEIVLLPAEVQPGDTWSSEGDAIPGGLLSYTADFTAQKALEPVIDVEGNEIPLTRECLGVESTVRIGNENEAISTTLIDSTVWCPGRGAVWSNGTIDGEPTGRAEERPVALAATDAPSTATARWSEVLDATSTLLPGRVLPLEVTDPFFGGSDATGQYIAPPRATSDGRLVTVNDRGDDVQVWNLQRASAALDWYGHPGGTVLSVGIADSLVIATTSHRQVVAYDVVGRRLWAWTADELVISAPIAAPAADGAAADIIIAARSGTVTRLDAANGSALWSLSLGADARSALSIVDGLLLVADEREQLTAVDTASGAIIWQRELGLVTDLGADASGRLVVAMLESGEAVALELDDGVERWSVNVRGLARGTAVTAETVVLLTDESTTALDARSGSERWRADGGESIVGGGASPVVTIVQPSRLEIRALDNGAVVDAQTVLPLGETFGRAALEVGGALVILDGDGTLQRWELR